VKDETVKAAGCKKGFQSADKPLSGSPVVALFTKLAVILAGAMWLGICVGLVIAARPSTSPCYDTLPASEGGGASQTSPGMCVDYTTPAIYALAFPGLIAVIVGAVLPVRSSFGPISQAHQLA